MPANRSYEDIVNYFQAACDTNLAVASFTTGPIDYLDSSAVNRYYPFVFLRPMSSIGVQGNTKTLSFELYSLDIPKLSDGNALKVMSNTEEILYTIASYFTLGPDQKYYDLIINTITPVNEAFQDRVFGWVADIDVVTPYTLNYCDFPTRP